MRIVENREIFAIIDKAISGYPELRFNQILHGLNVINKESNSFYDEPEEVLKRIRETSFYKEMNNRGSYKGVY